MRHGRSKSYGAATFCAMAFAMVSPLFSPASLAEAYPSKPIQLILPYSAGSGTDVMARAFAVELQREISGTIVIVNKPGANGSIAAEQLSKAAPDGYTLGMGTISPHSANPWLYKKLPYHPIDDFTPIARIIRFPFYLAVPGDSSITDLDQFLQAARTTSRHLNMGHGNATGLVAGAHLMKVADFEAVSVGYTSTPAALIDMVGSRLDFMFADVASSKGLLAEGKLRALAMMSTKRSSLMPDIPSLGEYFPGFDFEAWGGLLGPAGLPQPVVEKLSAAAVKVASSGAMVKRFESLGLESNPGDSKELATFMREQLELWGVSIRQAGMQPQ